MSPIDRYLDRLLAELSGSAADVRRVLAEAEEHLRDAAREEAERGLPEEEAQRLAVERFGSPRVVARRFGGSLPVRAVAGAIAWDLVPFTAIGLIAIGISGTISELLGRIFGPAFVSGDLPWVRYTSHRCAELQSYYPGRSCLTAAALDHWGEVVQGRVAAGVLGLMVLGGYALACRRRSPEPMLRPAVVPVAGMTAYGTAAAALSLQGTGTAMLGGMHGGSGQWWSAAAVALVAAVVYARSAYRTLLT